MTTDEEEQKTPWWISSINKLGLPTALLCCILFMLWRAGVWTADNVAMPLVKKQIEFIESAAKASEVAAIANKNMAAMTLEIRDSMQGQQSHGDHATEELKILAEGVVVNNKDTKINQELLKASAINDERSLKTLESIDATLKTQQAILQNLPMKLKP